MVYDVFYPDNTMDRDVSDGYLSGLARQGSRFNGARAVCKTGEPQRLVLRDGEWIDAPLKRAE